MKPTPSGSPAGRRLAGVGLEDLPIDLLGLRQPAGLVVPKGALEGFRDGGHGRGPWENPGGADVSVPKSIGRSW